MAFTILSQVKNLPLIRNTLKLASSNVILMFLPLLVTPILSRLYTPEDYGAWGIFSSLMFIVNSFIFLSYENVIVRTNSEKEVPVVVGLCVGVSLLITCFLYVVFFFGEIFNIQYFVKFPAKGWLFATLMIGACNTIMLCLGNRDKEYGKMSVANIINGAGQATIRILLGFFPIIPFGLIVGNVLSHFIALTFLFIGMYSYIIKLDWSVSVASIKSILVKYKKFPIYDAPSRFLEFTIGNMAIIVLSGFYESEYIGCYSMVVQFILMPISIVGSAMGTVYYKELSDTITYKKSIALPTSRVLKISFILSFLPFLFLILGGDKLLVLLLGEQWIAAGKMALIMAVFSVPVILTEPLLPAFRALDYQEQRLKYNILNIVFAGGILIVCCACGLDIYISLFFYSVAYATVRFLLYYKILKLTGIADSFFVKISPLLYTFLYFLFIIRMIIFKW